MMIDINFQKLAIPDQSVKILEAEDFFGLE